MIGLWLNALVAWLAARYPQRYRVVPRALDGVPMLRQFRLTRWCTLQSFVTSEASARLPERYHFHRWRWMFSVVLSGAFTEQRYPGIFFVHHKAPSFYAMHWSTVHRVVAVRYATWTLFFGFGRTPAGDWGYCSPPTPGTLDLRGWQDEIPQERRVDWQ